MTQYKRINDLVHALQNHLAVEEMEVMIDDTLSPTCGRSGSGKARSKILLCRQRCQQDRNSTQESVESFAIVPINF